MKEFVHLHLHTEYSLLDGAARIKGAGKESPLAEAVKAKNMSAVAITDHGNMFGVYSFVEAMRKAGIKAIIGSEFYTVGDIEINDPLEKRHHLILLAKDNEGYGNLMKLSSISYKDGFYYRPRIDLKTLKKYSKGLICLSACIQGMVPSLIVQDNYRGAKNYALELKNIFDEGDFYIELQDHGIPDEKKALPALIRIAREIGVKVVATNDVHYLEKSDADMQDVLMCISMKKQLSDIDRIKLEPEEFYLKSYDEMYEKFSYIEEALDNTVEIADKCNVTVKTKCDPGCYEIPVFDTPEKYGNLPANGGVREAAYLTDLAHEGIKRRYTVITDVIRDRLEYELKIIIKMGFAGYYLIVWDFINYSKTHGIPVGPGRGSGVGSIVAYAIGITNVDPLKYDLFFERFLNPERVSMPDFDIDFCTVNRERVIEYVQKKYGKEKVAQIITYGTLSARAVIKDVARVYAIPYADADKWAKAINNVVHISLNQALGRGPYKDAEEKAKMTSPDFIRFYEDDITARSIIDMSLRVENMPRQTGMHAAGVLICPKPVWEYVPLQRSGEYITTQFDKKQVEEMGLLKMDFLGLNTLTDINLALDYVEETTGKRPDLDAIDYDDANVYKLISDGETKAVFQVEQDGMRKFMMQLQPDCLEEIIAGVALYRPGPMQYIPNYIDCKFHPDHIHYLHPMLESSLKVTYGCIVYQEQVMQIAREVAGYSFGKADELRRAMGKKDAAKMAANKEIFINGKTDDNGNVIIDGAVKRGMPREIADELFEQIKKFAQYAFNKSHATAYSVLTYQTAWLKRYYPLCFLAAVLNNRITNADEVKNYINYLDSINIKVLPPDINKSKVKFSIEGNNLRFGLMAIKNVGEAAVESIISERDAKGDYADLEDLINRVSGANVNKRMIESMIKGGAFDCFNKTRATLMASYEQIMDTIARDKKNTENGQISLFDTLIDDEFTRFKYPDIPEYTEINRLMMEKDVLGMYVSGHPLNSFKHELSKMSFNTSMLAIVDDENESEDMDDTEIGYKPVNYDTSLDGRRVKMGGIINTYERKFTKRGDSMGVGVIEDLYGQIDFVLFSRAFDKCRDYLHENALLTMEGTLLIKEGERPKINVQSVSELTVEEHSDNVVAVADKSAGAEVNKKASPSSVRIILHGSKNEISGVVREVRTLLGEYAGGGKVFFVFDWCTAQAPEGVVINDSLVRALKTIVGRTNVELF